MMLKHNEQKIKAIADECFSTLPHWDELMLFLQRASKVLEKDAINQDPARMRKRCEALITAIVGKDMAPKWWNGPNKAFGGDTPEQIYSVAPSAVYAYLMKSSEGEW